MLSGVTTYSPKHPMSEWFETCPLGEVPPLGDPSRAPYILDQQLTLSGIGLCVWIGNAHSEIVTPTNFISGTNSCPSQQSLKAVRHIAMYLLKHPEGDRYGGHGYGLEQTKPLIDPFTPGKKANYFHGFFDGAVGKVKTFTGVTAYLAGGQIISSTGRQHLTAPDAHTVEVTAAGTYVNFWLSSSCRLTICSKSTLFVEVILPRLTAIRLRLFLLPSPRLPSRSRLGFDVASKCFRRRRLLA